MKRIIWILVVLVVAGAGAATVWFMGKGEVDRQLDVVKADAAARGWALTWSDREIEGFPVASSVRLKDAALVSEDGILIKAGDVRLVQDKAAPGTVVAELPAKTSIEIPIDGITRQSMPSLPERVIIDIASEDLRMILKASEGAPPAIVVTAGLVQATMDQDDAPVKLAIDARTLELVTEPDGKARKIRLKASTLTSDTRQVAEADAMTMVSQYSDVQIGATVAALDVDGFLAAYKALAENLIDGAFQSAKQSITISFFQAGQPLTLTWAAGPQTGLFSIDKGIVTYDSEDRDVKIVVDNRSMGMTVDATALFYQRRLQFPLTGGGATPREGAFRIAVEDFLPGDAGWQMVDPTAALGREPMDLLFDSKATMRLAGGGGGIPVEFSNVTLDAFELNALGATASATGDVEILQPINLPLGEIKVKMTGATALIGKLRQIGLLDDQRAQMADAILQVYARTGDGSDSHNTEVAFTNRGILVGGRPIDGSSVPDDASPLDPTTDGAGDSGDAADEDTSGAAATDGTGGTGSDEAESDEAGSDEAGSDEDGSGKPAE